MLRLQNAQLKQSSCCSLLSHHLTLQGFAGKAPTKAWLRQPSSRVWLLPDCSKVIVLTRTKCEHISCCTNPQLMLRGATLRSKAWSLSWRCVFLLILLFIIRIIHQANKTSLLTKQQQLYLRSLHACVTRHFVSSKMN